MKYIVPLIVIILFFVACGRDKKADEKMIITGTWLTPNPIDSLQSQGMTLRDDGSAVSVGMATLLYQHWKLSGDTLMLTYRSIGNRVSSVGTDSLRIVKLDSDSLVVSNGIDLIRYERSAFE